MTLAAASLLSVLAPAGCRESAPPPAPPPPAVTVATPAVREVIEWDEYSGHLDAVETVEVRARVSGMIVAVPFPEGTTVKRGDLLVEIDVSPYQAELDSQRANEARSKAQVDLSQIERDRIANVPPSARSATELDTAEAKLREAQAVLANAQAAVEAARLNVEWCKVTAPITGRISRRYVTPGNLISGGGQQATLLTTITSIDPIYCYVDADEHSVLKYQRLSREGKRVSARNAQIPCFLQLADEEGYPHEGVIDFVDNRVDPGTGTIRGRGVFPNPDGYLLPGLFARLRVPGTGRYRALLVPDAAVTSDQNQKVLLVVGPDNVVKPKTVTLGALFGEYRAITSGLDEDDRIVVNGLLHARPGARVTPQDTVLSLESFRLTAAGSPATQALPEHLDDDDATTQPSETP